MIPRNNPNNIIKITKEHIINYYNHAYYIKSISQNNLIKGIITKKEWNSEKIRFNLYKWYFHNYKDNTEDECKEYFKNKLKSIFKENEDTLTEIKKCKFSSNYTKICYKSMTDKLIELKDESKEKISYIFEYKHYNKITKKDDTLIMYIILTKEMSREIKNKDIYQFFGDATYRCVPPTFRKYRLYILSGFNLQLKKTMIVAMILIPNETQITYKEMFKNLKNIFGFNPRLFNMDFNKAECIALKEIFPNVYIIKCFFHYIQCLYKYIKKSCLNIKEYKTDISELLLNLKMLSFIEPDNISYIYKKKYIIIKILMTFITILKEIG